MQFTSILKGISMLDDNGKVTETCPAEIVYDNPLYPRNSAPCEDHVEKRMSEVGQAEYERTGKHCYSDYSDAFARPDFKKYPRTEIYTWTTDNGMSYTCCRECLRGDEFARVASPYEYHRMLRLLTDKEIRDNRERQAAKYGIGRANDGSGAESTPPGSIATAIPGHVIVAAFRIPDSGTLVPGQHVVIARPVGRYGSEDHGANHAHVVLDMWPDWDSSVSWSETSCPWMTANEMHDMSWQHALNEFTRRITLKYPDPTMPRRAT